MKYISFRISKWLKEHKHYFFKYNNGFFHLSYLANSPITMFESYKKMKFHDFDEKNNIIHSNTPFTKGLMQYVFLEEGLILVFSKMKFKNNISFTQVIDKELPDDYYFLSHNTIINTSKKRGAFINKIDFSNKSWSLRKPYYKSKTSFLKNSTTENIIVYFNKTWLKDYILKDKEFQNSSVKSFFDSKEKFVLWPDNSMELYEMVSSIKNIFLEESIQNKLQLKSKTLNLISSFIRNYNSKNTLSNYENLKLKDIIIANKIEFYLTDNLYNKFTGIEKLSEKFKISPTRLKTVFKSVYGMGIFTYFRQKQMKLAKELLMKNDCKIHEVSRLVGYENVSKFTNAFKTVNGVLPSQIDIT